MAARQVDFDSQIDRRGRDGCGASNQAHSNQAAGMIFPRGWDSRLAGRARCPDRPFQLPAHASGRPWPGWRRGRMLAGMSTAKRAVAARIAERRAARADRWRGRHHPQGPEGEPPVIRPATGGLRQIVRWVRRHYWAVQAVLVATALTLTALALVGLLGFWSQ